MPPSSAQLAATYTHMAKQAAAVAAVQRASCEAILEDRCSDADSDLGRCMICEVNELETDSGWSLDDAGSAVTVCPREFQEDKCTKEDATRARCTKEEDERRVTGDAKRQRPSRHENGWTTPSSEWLTTSWWCSRFGRGIWSDRSTAGEERSRRASQYDRKVLGSMGGRGGGRGGGGRRHRQLSRQVNHLRIQKASIDIVNG